MKTTRLIFFIFIVVLLCAAQQSFSATVAHWNFEDGTPGESFYDEGGSVDLQNGYVMNGEDDVNTGYFSQVGDGPGDSGVSADFNGTDQGCITTNATLNSWDPSVWTIECSVILDDLDVWETFIGKDGNSFDIAADFYLQKAFDTETFRINMLTKGPSGGDPVRYILNSDFNPVAGQWYHLAVVSDGTNLTMYADQLDGSSYQQVGTLAMSSTQSENELMGNFGWTFGRGNFDGNPVDYIDGRIDDVRFSDTALTPDLFLHDLNDLGYPSPADGEPNVWIDPLLEWQFVNPGITADSYDIYIGTDYNNVKNSSTPDYQTSNQSQQVNGLARRKTYYWRVDAKINGSTNTGAVWSFTTVGYDVVIKEQPQGDIAEAGTTAEISILAYNVDSYAWHKEGEGSAVYGTAATLSIPNVNLSDEGYYYCDVCDVNSNSLTSDSAGLWVKRLVGHWKFEENLNDSVQDTVSGAPVHNGYMVDSNAAGDGVLNWDSGGIDGNCMDVNFPFDGEYVNIYEPNFFNYWPLGYTSSCWTKMSVPDSGWGVTISKFDTFGWGVVSGGFREAFMGWAANVSGGEATVDEWVMLTSTFDAVANEFSLYVNGVQLYDGLESTTVSAVVPPEGGIPGNTAPVRIGTDNGDNGLRGLVDDVRLYNYPLSKAEVAQLYQQFVPGAQCVEPPANDYNNDCEVNFKDYAMIAEDWFKCNIYPDCLQ